jgi:hypothetical protein
MRFKSLRIISIACAGVALGLTLAHVLEQPGKAALSGNAWLVVQHTFYGGFAVLGGLAEVIGLASSLGCCVLARGQRSSAGLSLLAAVGFAGMLAGYAFGNRPINDQIAAWTPLNLPPDWTSARDRWEGAHTLNAVGAALALASLLTTTLRDSAAGAESASTTAREATRTSSSAAIVRS